MDLKQTKRTTLTDQIVDQLDGLIQSGAWPVGHRIPPEPELVKQLGVSRNTVREAVKSLIHAGMLEARQGDGTYVSSASGLGSALQRRLGKSGLMETIEVRRALEQEAARLAAERHTEEDAVRLRRRLDEFRAAADEETFIQADLNLHQEIIRVTYNSLYVELYDHLTEALKDLIRIMSAEKEELAKHDRIHGELIGHILARDADAAAEAVREHIRLSSEWIGSR